MKFPDTEVAVLAVIDIAKAILKWIGHTPVAIAFIIAAVSVGLEFWLKINSRKRQGGNKLWTREDMVWWPNWVVSSFVAGILYFFTPGTAIPPKDSGSIGWEVATLVGALFLGSTLPPFLQREKGYRNASSTGGSSTVQELRPIVGIFWPNAVGLVTLLVVVYSGLKSPLG